MNEDGDILEDDPVWFGKSVICSAVKLAYEHAQDMIDQPGKDWRLEELPDIQHPWTAQVISQKVNMLQKLAVKLRSRRVENGALRLDKPKLSFNLDKESGMPQGYKVYEQRQSNRLIEEFMLLANISVAGKIFKSFPHNPLRTYADTKSKILMTQVWDKVVPYIFINVNLRL